MIPPKETKETLITDPQEMEIYELPDKEFKIISLRKLINLLASSTSWNQDCWREKIKNLRYADDTTLRAEGEEELKSLLM